MDYCNLVTGNIKLICLYSRYKPTAVQIYSKYNIASFALCAITTYVFSVGHVCNIHHMQGCYKEIR